MSLPDDIQWGKNFAIRNARARVAYGKHFDLRQLALQITSFRRDLLKEYGTLPKGLDALMWNVSAKDGLLPRASHFGTRLLQFALMDPRLLRKVAEAFPKLVDTGTVDPRAEEIITAYEQCLSFPPSFSELKCTFTDRFGEDRWFGDFAVRKTLRSLKLALSKSKRGRPPGSRSKL